MKQLWILMACAAPLLGLQAQTMDKLWTGSHYSLSMGGAMDYHSDMNMDWMREHTVQAHYLDLAISDDEFANYHTVSGGVFGFEKSFRYTPTQASNQRWSRELRLGLRVMANREAMVSYYRYEEDEFGYDSESLVICLLDNEMGVEVAHLWRVDGRYFSAYGGLGANASATFNPQMLKIRNGYRVDIEDQTSSIVMESWENDTETYEAKTSVFARFMAPVGVAWYPISRLSVGLEYRAGMGVEQVIDGAAHVLPYSSVIQFRLSYHLRGGFRV